LCGGSVTPTASGNTLFTLSVVLREPLVEIGFHWGFLKPAVSDLGSINTHSSSPTESCSSQPTSIKGDFRGPDFTKYKGKTISIYVSIYIYIYIYIYLCV
jgi:hypothetical protein